eukprot:TRINITY_DN6395_c0_g2_i1.p2 TRINITY_DN6395_c0_g2~~TRINITY_DN6395_c0_g2_i1.p2  ORF type:complete len:178 (+),score=67.79 TRINITY_DN6395_c0_g2_i1:64-534(+)
MGKKVKMPASGLKKIKGARPKHKASKKKAGHRKILQTADQLKPRCPEKGKEATWYKEKTHYSIDKAKNGKIKDVLRADKRKLALENSLNVNLAIVARKESTKNTRNKKGAAAEKPAPKKGKKLQQQQQQQQEPMVGFVAFSEIRENIQEMLNAKKK